MQRQILINVMIFFAYALNLPLNTQRPHHRSQRAGKLGLDFGSWQSPDILRSHLYRGTFPWTPPTAIYRAYTVLHGALMFSLMYAWTNSRVASDLRLQDAHVASWWYTAVTLLLTHWGYHSLVLSHRFINSLWPSDAIWWQRTGSTLVQVMACCLTAPSHYLNQCWLSICMVQWHSYEVSFTRDTSAIDH